jgi:hypothetical protein
LRKEKPLIVPFSPATSDVLLFYPGPSLRERALHWNGRWNIETSSVGQLPAVRRMSRRSGAVVIDATADSSRAVDAFLQAVACLGPEAVMMYTEKTDAYLELFVRMRGSLLLLGPLFDHEWDEVFQSLLVAKRNPTRLAA